MAPDGIWVPGAPQPSLEDFVARLHKHIERFGSERAEGEVSVEVELRDGSVLRLVSIDPEPGYGFITLSPHRDDGESEELIVPVAAVTRLQLTRMEQQPPFGFAQTPEAA